MLSGVLFLSSPFKPAMLIPALLLVLPLLPITPIQAAPGIELGRWRAELESPGGALPFTFDLQQGDEGLVVWLINDSERIPLADVTVKAGQFKLEIHHYQSRIHAKVAEDQRSMTGTWSKLGGDNSKTEMPFFAELSDEPRFLEDEDSMGAEDVTLSGRWEVRFSSSKTPAVGLFRSKADGTASGTFLTTLGDYRYLEGTFRAGRLRLSCFDGAHAFLFDAILGEDGLLRGDFWSRDSWHETWIAELNADAKLPDPFSLSRWREEIAIDSLKFVDPRSREPVSLGDERFAGKLRLIQLFGTWCPNCHDEAPFLAELYRTYKDQGLEVVGLAFEHSGRLKNDILQIERFRKRHSIPYPLLIGGDSNKEQAAKEFGALKEVLAYPTVLFVDAKGQVRYVHTGFTGPAAGEAHAREKERFHELIQELLGEAKEKR